MLAFSKTLWYNILAIMNNIEYFRFMRCKL